MTDGTYDVAIIGSGFAGSLFAESLVTSGLSVVVIEAGQAYEEERHIRQTLRDSYATSAEDDMFAPFTELVSARPRGHKSKYYVHADNGRSPDFHGQYLSILGGSGLAWLGTALRMCPSDFRMQSTFGRGRDWPISYDDLEPWYCAAEKELGVAGTPETEEPLGTYRSKPFPMPPVSQSYLDRYVADRMRSLKFDGQPVDIASTPQARNTVEGYNGRPQCEGYGSCVPLCPTGAKYDPLIHLRRALLAGAELLTESVVTDLTVSHDGAVTSAAFRGPDGTEASVQARVFVLAANGIETPKLLLMSNRQYGDGLANESGQVGRNLMDHPSKHSCALLQDPIFPYRGPQSTSGIDGLRDGAFRKYRAAFRTVLRNDGWRIMNGAPFGSSAKLLDGTLLELVGQKKLTGKALRSAIQGVGQRQFALQSVLEMLPRPENRISLSADLKDGWGLPRPEIRFEIDGYERAGIAAAAELHTQVFRQLGCEDEDMFIHLQDDPTKPDTTGSHIMGTTMMGEDPSSSVVDTNCRAHGHRNLFIAGSSVFPTGATSNPTLTISALALRAAQHIKQTIQMV